MGRIDRLLSIHWIAAPLAALALHQLAQARTPGMIGAGTIEAGAAQ
jgi:hypothetical protein